MKIAILCSDPLHPVMEHLIDWSKMQSSLGHEIIIVDNKSDLVSGDFLFLISCSQIIEKAILKNFKYSLVLHASDLPKGRGWSPYIWSILNGEHTITVSLLEVAEKVDTGRIWLKKQFALEGHELAAEINNLLFKTEVDLMSEAIENHYQIQPYEQRGDPTYWVRRLPNDSRLDPNKTISEQIDLLRVADNNRYPCFFDHRGHRYLIKIEKANNE
ncbi:formyltransferase family protein [Methylophilus aquaticus]|uniref:Formyltransferase family protein n=1 Tax=Methylophilus aquaticus TaxID=1971610 RepID=A0ABT9JU78_9PROT|nr:formyltransferase family protein [Methylophilus aquaticus]MDP8568084.1 formyltransferase family protein [Methylophilus aquaticus]